MADKEFEEFGDRLDQLPQHFKAADHTYRLVHAITPSEENKSFLEKVQLGEKLCGIASEASLLAPTRRPKYFATRDQEENLVPYKLKGPQEDDLDSSEDEDVLTSASTSSSASKSIRWHDRQHQQRPRSRLMPSFTKKSLEFHNCPNEIVPPPPINRIKSGGAVSSSCSSSVIAVKSLFQELEEASQEGRGNLALCLNKGHEEEEDLNGGDVDSGNSTSHSPAEDKTCILTTSSCFGESSLSTSSCLPMSPLMSSTTTIEIEKPLELLEPTHRGLHRFLPRHSDEIEIDIGDPVYVQKEAEDLWCEGANLRTGDVGIFPIAHVVDVDYNDLFDPENGDDKKERYLLDYLGSVETSLYKGNIVLCQAVRKILGQHLCQPQSTVLEISHKGIKMQSKSKPAPGPDYFFNLKNVTFCGFHPKEPRYFGFVTKHPRKIKYACHVFLGQRSTQHVAEACGRAFQRFYKKFMETAYPVEDIYLE